MLIIKLQRTGKRNQPFFRIVLTEKKAPPKGKLLEKLGFLNPLKKERKVNSERVKYWLSKGAQVSDTVYNILIEEKIIEGEKRKIKIKPKKKKKGEIKEEEKGESQAKEGFKSEEDKTDKKVGEGGKLKDGAGEVQSK